MQNQSKREITFDTELKTALYWEDDSLKRLMTFANLNCTCKKMHTALSELCLLGIENMDGQENGYGKYL